MTDMRDDVDSVLAQLRHAYAQLVAGTVVNQPAFARGLVGPQIKKLENIRAAITAGDRDG